MDISFTNAGSYRRAVRTGKHVEPLGKIFASCKMLPSKETLPDAMMRARYPESQPLAHSEAAGRSAPAAVEVAPRWPCAAHFERPKSSASGDARAVRRAEVRASAPRGTRSWRRP